jgi:hypothetical protein
MSELLPVNVTEAIVVSRVNALTGVAAIGPSVEDANDTSIETSRKPTSGGRTA